jgi:hypothetical protein
MSHEFSVDPIKLRIVDIRTGEWKRSYIFVGNVPSNVEKELHKLERNINLNSTILKKFYGPAWRDRLGITSIISSKKKHGGTEMVSTYSDEDLDKLNLDNLDAADNPNATDDNDQLFDDNIMKDIGVELDVESIIDTADDYMPIEDNITQTDFLEERKETLAIAASTDVKFIYDTTIYPVDNIIQFKYKIFHTLGIPIYRQHLWFKYKNKSYPASYSLSVHKHIENIDIERLIAFYNTDKVKTEDNINILSDIEGIPVELEYYKNKDFIHVSAQDTFNLLQTIYYKYATNEYYLTDLNDILKPSEIYGKLSKDKYQLEVIYYGFVILYFPMITFSVFTDYLKNERIFNQIYPELVPSKRELQHRYELETSITNSSYEFVDDKTINKKLFSSITQTVVSIDNYNQDIEMLISLRNLFDVVQLNDTITYCKANVLHDNQNIILRKSYLNEKEPKDVIPINSLLIKIKVNMDTNENMRLVIFKNGNYIIRTDWREENHMDFQKVIKLTSERINPIIRMINKMSDRVKYYDVPIMELAKDNSNFTETSLTFYYDDDVTDARFNLFKSILEDYRQAGIIIPKENVALGYEYFFSKGMYKYDASRIEKAISTENYYDHLSNGIVRQKWETVFERTRLFQILNISSKLKISISGIRNDTEMSIFHMYLIGLLKIYSDNASKIKIVGNETVQAKSKRALKNLKVQDPLLYDFKKIYKSNVVYSKICQKPYQPLILSDDEYKKLPSDKKSAAIKYWNFTKQKPVWYSCPNMKYPYIKFIVKQHPRDFCIPCCKKIAMNEKVNKKKREIHSSCMKEHAYTGEKVNLTKGSHYIASYGKIIEVGRLSRLPEHTLEPLFFDTYSPESGGVDQECATADGYYLFGLDQNTPTVNNIGYLFCLVHSLNIPVDQFLTDCASKIRKAPDKFRVILDGNAGLYFNGVSELADTIVLLNDRDTLLPNKIENLPWNLLFMSIGYYYYGVNTILFDDQQKEMIELILPKGLKNADELFPDSHKNLVILRHKDKYYPVYLFNTEIFKRTGIIDTRLFLNESGLIAIIKAVVRKTFEVDANDKIRTSIDLAVIKDFVKSNVGLSIVAYYINYSNLCYGVVLKYKAIETYFPVVSSHYPLEKNTKMIFEPYNGKYDVKYTDIKIIIDLFAKWNAVESKKEKLDLLIYPQISVEQWLKVANTHNIIGFNFANTNYFIKPITEKEAVKLDNKPIQTILYHPYKINELIYSVKSGKIQLIERTNDLLEKSMYDYYVHQLVLLQFISIFNTQRNTALRKKLTMLLSKTDFNKDLEKLREFIVTIDDTEDVAKLKHIISRFITTHHDKKRMLVDIDEAYFNFDKIALESMKRLPVDKINKELHILSKKFVTIGTIKSKTFKFPNMLTACGSVKESIGYCNGDKLIVEKQKLDDILDVLANDIANPAKWKWLFNVVFITKVVDFFKFIRRKNEYITIEFL